MGDSDFSATPRHYSRLVCVYDWLHSLQTFGRDRCWRREAALAVPTGARRVLDLCTGTGLTVAAVRQHRPESTVFGIDWNPAVLRRARRRFADDECVRLLQGDVEHLPFPDGTFDAVTAICALGGVTRPHVAVHEAARVLLPRGVFFAVDMCAPRKPGVRRLWHKTIVEPWIRMLWAFRDIPLEEITRAAPMGVTRCEYRMEFGLGSVCVVQAVREGDKTDGPPART